MRPVAEDNAAFCIAYPSLSSYENVCRRVARRRRLGLLREIHLEIEEPEGAWDCSVGATRAGEKTPSVGFADTSPGGPGEVKRKKRAGSPFYREDQTATVPLMCGCGS
jgi:hypothetical protein